MAQLNSSLVQGSLRVTDTTYTNDLNISSVTASKIAKIDANKNLTSGDLAASEIPNLSTDKLTSGTLGVARGGTGAASFTANSLIMSGSTTTAALTTRTITNNTSNTAITNNNTNIPTMNTIYYGLVAVNNASQTRATGIYAPTTAGTANQILISKGGTNAPEWTAAATLASATNATSGTVAYTNLTLGNNVNVSSATAHSEGKITLYSAATNAHIIQGQSTTNDITHTLPNATGWLATGATGGVGSTDTPVYLTSDGTLTAVSAVSYSLLPTNDQFILTGDSGNNTNNNARATIPSNYALNRKIFYSSSQPTTEAGDIGMFWFTPAAVTLEQLKCYRFTSNSTSSLPLRISDENITSDMAVINCVLSNPSVQVGEITWTTTDGELLLNGTITGSTQFTCYLIRTNEVS